MCVIECNEIEWLYIFMRVNFKRSFSFNDLVNLLLNGVVFLILLNGLECFLLKCMFFECFLN